MARIKQYKALLGYLFLVLAIAYTLTQLQAQGASLAQTQRAQAVTQKASTSTRVNTVESRCQLTLLLVHTAEKAVPSEYPQYHASYLQCEKQLAVVKAINARTPYARTP